MCTRVIIYEDNFRLRQSLQLLLNEGGAYEVVGAYADCDNIIADVRELCPHLIIMDLDMPGIGGLEGIRLSKNAHPESKIVVHTVFDDDNRIFECICAGADGYMLKKASPQALLQSLEDLMKGDAPMSPFVAQKVFQYFRDRQPAKNDFHLTRREIEILEELVKGDSYKMIAAALFLSVDTVRKHLQNIYHKLQVNSGTEAVIKALQHKIIHLD